MERTVLHSEQESEASDLLGFVDFYQHRFPTPTDLTQSVGLNVTKKITQSFI